jgi:cell division protein FtsN
MEQDFAKRRIRTPLAEPSPPARASGLVLLLTGMLTGIVIGMFISLLAYLSGLLPPAPGQQTVAETARSSAFAASSDTNGEVLSEELVREATRLQLEFYRELPNYEVVVDVTPVNVPQPRVLTPPAETAATIASTDAPAADSNSNPAIATGNTNPTANASGDAPLSLDQVIAELTGRAPEAAVSNTPPSSPPATGGSYMLQAGAFQQAQAANTQLNRLINLGVSARIREESMPGRILYLVQAGPYDSREAMLAAERVLRASNIDTMRITLSQP